jgi:phage terminase small subunit
VGFKKPREATRQATTTLATIIVPLANAMPHKTQTLISDEKIVEKVIPTGTK